MTYDDVVLVVFLYEESIAALYGTSLMSPPPSMLGADSSNLTIAEQVRKYKNIFFSNVLITFFYDLKRSTVCVLNCMCSLIVLFYLSDYTDIKKLLNVAGSVCQISPERGFSQLLFARRITMLLFWWLRIFSRENINISLRGNMLKYIFKLLIGA